MEAVVVFTEYSRESPLRELWEYVKSIRLETFGPFMTAIYDGPDPAYEGCGLKDLLESDIGHRIFLSEEAAKAYYNV